MMSIQLAACLRVSELLNIKCNDVEFKDGELIIQLEKTKTDTSNPLCQGISYEILLSC